MRLLEITINLAMKLSNSEIIDFYTHFSSSKYAKCKVVVTENLFGVLAVTSPELEMLGVPMKVLSEMDVQWM